MEIKGASIVSTSGNPADPEPTTVLVLEAPVTVDMADMLKCRYLYTLNDQPVKFEGSIKLPLELGEDEGELSLSLITGARVTLRPLKIHNFKVSHVNDLRLGVEFRAHFKGVADGQQINEFLHATNKTEFVCWVGSTQGELFADAPAAGDGPAGGKRVNMSGAAEAAPIKGPLVDAKPAKEKTGCKACDAGIPMQETGDSHVNGESCSAFEAKEHTLQPTAAEKKAARLEEERKKKAAREQSGIAAVQ